jgi:hypothetical protein
MTRDVGGEPEGRGDDEVICFLCRRATSVTPCPHGARPPRTRSSPSAEPQAAPRGTATPFGRNVGQAAARASARAGDGVALLTAVVVAALLAVALLLGR